MNEMRQPMGSVLLAGDHPVKKSIASCLELSECTSQWFNETTTALLAHCEMGILVTEEDLDTKKMGIAQLEKVLPPTAIIGVNTENIGLDQLQEEANFPDRILGLNWTEPADTTFFLEIIANEMTHPEYSDRIFKIATEVWHKDPYVIYGNTGIRTRLIGALLREAFYLIKNDYATVEDIDRACRNDAGYYLPFAGNLRYMDLMGTYAYGMVMKDLNPELSTDQEVPEFFEKMMEEKSWGMKNGKGFYEYQPRDAENWQQLLGKFGQEVKEIIEKYPFKYESTHF